MDTRSKMKAYRRQKCITRNEIARKAGVSDVLIGMVEAGEVTHPLLVKRIQKAYGLTDLEAEELLPKNRRPHDPSYDPDKYVAPDTSGATRTTPKQQLVERYMTEHLNEQAKNHARRSTY